MWMRNGARRSRLPLVRPSRSLLRAPPGARLRRAARGRVSRPGGTSRTSRRLTTVGAVRSVRHRLRRHITAVVTAVGAVSSAGGGRSRCLPHCLLVVLQHLGHGCLHGPACFLALLAQLATQSQGGCPGGTGRYACSSCSGRLVCGAPAGCDLTGELTGLVAARQRGRRHAASPSRNPWANAQPIAPTTARPMRARIPTISVMMKPPKMKKERRREENVKRRRAGARQSAHYELTTFRYRPRCTETRREAAVPPSRAASAVAV